MESNNVSDTVSVVIPCYNGAQFLREALDSVLTQTRLPKRMIIVDDGSSDNSADLIRDYIKQHADCGIDIQLIEQENQGEPAARNTGIQASDTTWIANLDTDDWCEPTKLEKQLKAAEAAGDGCVLVHTGARGIYPDGSKQDNSTPPKSSREGWVTKALLESESIAHPAIMTRRSALESIGGYNAEFIQACDIDLYFRLSVVGTFAFVPERLLNYRYHAGQMSANPTQQIRYHHRAIRDFFEAHPEKETEIGSDFIKTKLSDHVALKLQSLYWRRNLEAFRDLLQYASENQFDNADIRHWRKKARWPNWLIRAKDRLDSRRGNSPTNTEPAEIAS